ncbi:MAG: hypothetical protein R6W68_00495 [Ignavibacteriaceae bacterium]
MTETKDLFITLSTDPNLNRKRSELITDKFENAIDIKNTQDIKTDDNEWLVEYESIYRSYQYEK